MTSTDDIPVAVGPYTVPLAKMADMLAGTASFQTRMGLLGDPLAVSKCARNLPFPALERAKIREYLPSIIIMPGPTWSMEEKAGGSLNYLRPAGSLKLIFADNARFGDDLTASARDFCNWIGQTFQDLAQLWGSDALLSGRRVRQDMAPAGCSEKEENSAGLYFMASFVVEWD